MYPADPLTTSLAAACVAVLMVHAGLGKRMLVWKVAANADGAGGDLPIGDRGKGMCSHVRDLALRSFARRRRG